MLQLIDKFAGWWLDARTRSNANKLNGQYGAEFRKVDFEADGENFTVKAIMEHPAVSVLAEEACALLEEGGGDNYLEFTLMPRIDKGRRPIVVTLRWFSGKTPAEKAAEFKSALSGLHDACRALVADVRACYPEGIETLGTFSQYIEEIEAELDAADSVLGVVSK